MPALTFLIYFVLYIFCFLGVSRRVHKNRSNNHMQRYQTPASNSQLMQLRMPAYFPQPDTPPSARERAAEDARRLELINRALALILELETGLQIQRDRLEALQRTHTANRSRSRSRSRPRRVRRQNARYF